jgi:hypothetical protein
MSAMSLDITGQRFGRLVAICVSEKGTHRRHTKWLLECDCGNRKVTTIDVLRRGDCQSCGCFHREISRRKVQPVAKKFWSHVQKTERCWLWVGVRSSDGYGRFEIRNHQVSKVFKAHQMSWILLRGPVPDGLQLDHLCRVRHCVNPDHLEPVTMAENIRRGISPWGLNAQKTHCPRGHELMGPNLYVTPGGGRSCKTCRRDQTRRCRQRKLEHYIAAGRP